MTCDVPSTPEPRTKLAVAVPFFTKSIDDQGVFVGGDTQDAAAKTMLDELAKWTGGLKGSRG